MAYTIMLQCGCRVYVACHPVTRAAHTRIIETRGSECQVRRHRIGLKLYLWDLLPERSHVLVDNRRNSGTQPQA